MCERQSLISMLRSRIVGGLWKSQNEEHAVQVTQDKGGGSVSLPSPINCPNSPANLALLERQMPEIRKRAKELFEKGKISKERLEFLQEVSVEGLAYEQLKLQHPDFNWTEWELGGSH